MQELERTFLMRAVPEGLREYSFKGMADIYIPKASRHPVVRLRKNGNKFCVTKKTVVKEGDASHFLEQTIDLTEEEFLELSNVGGKEVRKRRYLFDFDGRTAEIDVFEGALKGLVLVDFEFETKEEMDAFMIPNFCLAEVTQEEFTAGGMLCGKSYEEIEPRLRGFGYSKLFVD